MTITITATGVAAFTWTDHKAADGVQSVASAVENAITAHLRQHGARDITNIAIA